MKTGKRRIVIGVWIISIGAGVLLGVFSFSTAAQPSDTELFDFQTVGVCREVDGGFTTLAYDTFRKLCFLGGSGNMVVIIDVSDPTNPHKVSDIYGKIHGSVTDIYYIRPFLYVITDKGLEIWDLSAISSPHRLAVYSIKLSQGFILGSFAYVIDSNRRLRILDISQPAIPREVGIWEASEGLGPRSGHVFVGEDMHAYVTEQVEAGKLWVIDVSNPMNPQEIGTYESLDSIQDTFISGSYGYVAAGTDGLKILDFSDPAHPREVSSCDSIRIATRVFVHGPYAYVVDDYSKGGAFTSFKIIDISSPGHPREIGSHSSMDASSYRLLFCDPYIYVTSYFEALHIYELLSLEAMLTPPALTPGRIAFVSDRDGNKEIYLVDANGENLINITRNAADDWAPTWSPDAKEILFRSTRQSNLGQELYVMDANGDNAHRITTLGQGSCFSDLAWSADGGHIVGTLQGDVYVINTDGTNLRNLTNDSEYEGNPSWSPDGKKIAFESRHGIPAMDIWCVNVDGTGLRNLTNRTETFDKDPAWSPDGTRITFVSRRDGNHEIYVMRADGANPRNLTRHPAQDYENNRGWGPVWSPDGKKIGFVSRRDGNWEIYVMNSDGSSPLRLTNDNSVDGDPCWSPDSTKIAWVSQRYGSGEIMSMNIDGTGLQDLTNNFFRDDEPTWSAY